MSSEKTSSGAQKSMDDQAAKLFAASLRDDLPTLDLHNTYPDEVVNELEIFLSRAIEKDFEVVRVIYGGGTGKLREITLNYLQNHKLIGKIEETGGSSLVLLRN